MSDNVPREAWDGLYQEYGRSPRYPHDAVVRWAFATLGTQPQRRMRILDVGSGSGRHSIFLAKHGHVVTATDYSHVALAAAKEWAREESLAVDAVPAGADDLPFDDDSFDALLNYGVLCYLSPPGLKKAVGEFRRVLRPGGQGLIVTRTTDDSRYTRSAVRTGKTAIAPDAGDVPWKGEVGMSMTFLSRNDVESLFSDFSVLNLDRMSFTQVGGKYINDDWLIFCAK